MNVGSATSIGTFSSPVSTTPGTLPGSFSQSSTQGLAATVAQSNSGTSAAGSLAQSFNTPVSFTGSTNLFDDRFYAPSSYLSTFPTSGLDPHQAIYQPSNQAVYSIMDPNQALQVSTTTTGALNDPTSSVDTGTGGTSALASSYSVDNTLLV